MKKLMVIFCCLLSACLYAQKPDAERGNIGITFSPLGKSSMINFLDDDSYSESNYLYSLGINYIYPLNTWLDIETGIEYSAYNIKRFGYPDGITRLYAKGNLSLITVPLTLRANFLRFIFANAGIFFDFDSKRMNDIIDRQTGIGFIVGLGFEYDFKCGISLFANPFLRCHSVLPFVTDGYKYHRRLLDGGFRFGITYNLNKIHKKEVL